MRLFHVCLSPKVARRSPGRSLSALAAAAAADTSSTRISTSSSSSSSSSSISSCSRNDRTRITSSNASSSSHSSHSSSSSSPFPSPSSHFSTLLHSLFSSHHHPLDCSGPSAQWSLSFSLCLLLYISFSLTTVVVCSAQQQQQQQSQVLNGGSPNEQSWLRAYSGGGEGGGGSGRGSGGSSRPYAHSFYDHRQPPPLQVVTDDGSSIEGAAAAAAAARERFYLGGSAPEMMMSHQQPNVIRDRYLQFRDWLANPLQYLRHHNLLKQMLPANANGAAVKQPNSGAKSNQEEAGTSSSTTPSTTSTFAPLAVSKLEERAFFGTVNRKPEPESPASSASPLATAASDNQIAFIMKAPVGGKGAAEGQSGSVVQKGPPYGVVRTSPSRSRSRVGTSSRGRGNSRPQIVPVFDPFGNEMGQFSIDYGKKAAASTSVVGMPRHQEYSKEGGIPLYGGDMGVIPGSFHDEPVGQPFAKFSPNRKFVGDDAPKRMRSSSSGSSNGQFASGRGRSANSNNAGNRRYHVMRAM